MASASPSASAAVVLAVGTRFIGHASSDTWQSRATSDASASVEEAVPQMAMSRAPSRLIVSTQAQQLVRLAAVRQRQDDVVALNDAQVAVDRFRRVQKKRRRPGAGQRRGNLSGDDAGFPHARDDHSATAVEQHADGPIEAIVEAIDQRQDGGGFCLQNLSGNVEVRGGQSGSCTSSADGRVGRDFVTRRRRDSHQSHHERFETIEAQRVGGIASRAGWLLVHLHEHGVGARRDAR